MFGKDKVYRAGVVAIKEEFEAQKILDEIIKDNQLKITDERKKKLLGELVGTFKTIGQNPGGRFIIPKEKSIYDFTPITYPCDNKKYNKVTYFDYHDLNKTLLKINILFHDSVSILKGIEDITGINSNKISFDDKETMELIQSGNTDNIFEFKTETVKKMILKEKPTNIQELINIVIKAHSNKYYTLSKAHASSYVVLAYKLAWFKVHYPKGFKMISSKYE